MAKLNDPAPDPMAPPDTFQAVLKVAFEVHNAGRHAEAEALCRVLLDRHAHDPQLRFLLGMVLHRLGRDREALEHLTRAAELPAPAARVFNALGLVQHALGEEARAVASYELALALGPPSADTFYSLGNACYNLGEVERAISCFQQAVALHPRDAASWNNLAKCLKDCNRLEESLAAYDQSLAADPDYPLARYGRTIVLLTAGRLPEGFYEYNQWRNQQRVKPREFPRPAWRGEPVPGRTLFLHAEQGFGDALQDVRFIPLARARAGAAKVILECRPELKTLFVHSSCADVVIAYGETIPAFDCWTSLISLPGLLDMTAPTIPGHTPYLQAPHGPPLPAAPAGHRKVGLVWAGNPAHHNDAARSLRLAELAPLLQVPGVTFYSLQRPVPARDEAAFRSTPNLVDLGGRLDDFLATAAAVAQLDLVIAVDTAVAHLAGALGKPTWTLLPFSPDWRWFLDRPDTPWYPTMRLCRQPQRGQWPPVLRQVAAALAGFTPPPEGAF